MRKSSKLFSIVILLVLILQISFAGCKSGDAENLNNDLSDELYITGDINTTDPQVQTEAESVGYKASLIQLNSTGEISYSDFTYNFSPKNRRSIVFSSPELFKFRYSNEYGFADCHGNVIIDSQFYNATAFSEGKAFVKTDIDSPWSVIDINGKVLFTLPNEIDASSSYFLNGKAIFVNRYPQPNVQVDFRIYVLDEDMNLTDTLVTVDVYADNDCTIVNNKDFSGICVGHTNVNMGPRTWTIYDTEGNIVAEYSQSLLSECFRNNMVMSLNSDYTRYVGVSNEYINVMNDDGKWGLMDINTKELVVDYKYDYIGFFSEDSVSVCKYGKWGSINLNGDELISCKYKYLAPFVNGKAFVITEDYQYGFIDKNDNLLSTFSSTYFFNNSYYVYPFSAESGTSIVTTNSEKSKSMVYIISDDSEMLLSVPYSELCHFSDNYIVSSEGVFEISKVPIIE